MLGKYAQDQILCVDALTYADNLETMAAVMDNPNFKFIKADIADRETIYSNYNVIASINAAGYDMSTGKSGGLFVMGGVEYCAPNANGFFGILKDGTAMIGTTAEYYERKEQGMVIEGIAGFGATLVKAGKITVSHSDSFTNERASCAAIGITKTGKNEEAVRISGPPLHKRNGHTELY